MSEETARYGSSKLERDVIANTLSITALSTRLDEELHKLRKQLLSATFQPMQAQPVTMPNPLPGQTMSNEQVWLTAWASTSPESGKVGWSSLLADVCLADFKARFRQPKA